MSIKRILCCVMVFSVVFGFAAEAEKVVVAHRGASGYLPEHTLEAYAMAYAQGADYIEPDLVLTKDGVFICLHDIHLEATTDVEQKFPDRKREDGRWYAADFTLAEIKTLQAHERVKGRFPLGKSSFRVATFAEMIELIQGLNTSTGNDIGIYPELKAPSFHTKEGLPMEQPFLDIMAKYGYTGSDANVFVQCFEAPALKKMRELGSELPQVLVIGGRKPGRSLSDEGLDDAATFAQGVGPSKDLVKQDPSIVERAHARGLIVHVYTLRADSFDKEYGSFDGELEAYYTTYGVDGIWTDHPDLAVQWFEKNEMKN